MIIKLWKYLQHQALMMKWAFIIAWRQASDRWFIFRDAPDEVVIHFIAMGDCVEPGDVVEHAAKEAAEELQLRMLQLRRKIEASRRELGADGE